jgi:serine protease
VAEAIEYAVDSGADIINLSLGLPCRSNDLKWAMSYAEDNGVVVVGAAGNDSNEKLHYPAGYSNGLAVAATDDLGVLAPFSNYHENLNISAPGVNIYSAYGEGQFAWWSGTSQATPMVSGQAALLLQADAALTPVDIRNLIKQSGKDVAALNPGYEHLIGGGLADTFAGLNLIGSVLVDDSSEYESSDSIDSPDVPTNTSGGGADLIADTDSNSGPIIDTSTTADDIKAASEEAAKKTASAVNEAQSEATVATARAEAKAAVAAESEAKAAIAWAEAGAKARVLYKAKSKVAQADAAIAAEVSAETKAARAEAKAAKNVAKAEAKAATLAARAEAKAKAKNNTKR